MTTQGVSDKQSNCETCHQKMADCVGHYAYIKLVLPVFHIGYFKQTITMLQDICKVHADAFPPPPHHIPPPPFL